MFASCLFTSAVNEFGKQSVADRQTSANLLLMFREQYVDKWYGEC